MPDYEPFIQSDLSLAQVTQDIASRMEARPGALWWAGLAVCAGLFFIGLGSIAYLLFTGVGILGLTKTIGWGFLITNFVFWVGIGHAGTLISAILLLLRQRWRTSINRSAEAMTLFALSCAVLFPLMHLGRSWFFYWLLPYPNSRGSVWPNFRSPLLWDMFAITTYFTVSLVFWYLGLIPDLATLRDRAKGGWKKVAYGISSLGWSGSARAWHRYELVYMLLAGLATPLVLSVHSLVSCDFATSLLPGWHSTIFPPYFVAGAIFSGFAMVLSLMLVARQTMNLQAYITLRHVDAMCKVTLLTACLVALSYFIETFNAWSSGNRYERFLFLNRFLGDYAWASWIMAGCNVLAPQALWFKAVRTNVAAVFVISILINVGMWFERFVIIVGSLSQDFMPSSWTHYHATFFDFSITFGVLGLFLTLFLLFCRFFPVVSISEVKHELADQALPEGGRP